MSTSHEVFSRNTRALTSISKTVRMFPIVSPSLGWYSLYMS